MGSKRLPGKTLLPIAGKPAIGLLVERLRYARKIDEIILATTDRPEDDAIEGFCRENRVTCFRGDADDVLRRVRDAARKYRTDVIVEVTGDCPLLDPWLIDECIDIFLKSDYDYLSNFIEQTYPPGIDVQIFTTGLLNEMNRLAKGAKFREHVTLYLIKNMARYRVHNVEAPKELRFPDWHLELDEESDYEMIKKIYGQLYSENPRFTTADIIDILKKHPGWLKINKDVHRTWEKAREQ